MKKSRKTPTSFTLTSEDKARLRALAQHYGISQAGVIEFLTREGVRQYQAHYDPTYHSSSRRLEYRDVTIPHVTIALSQEAHQSIAALAQHLRLNKTGVLRKLLLDQFQAAGLQLIETSPDP